MPVRLTIRPPRTTESQVVEFDEERVTIGRSSRCDVRIPLRVVSGHHLTLLHSDDGLLIRDEQSTNGTLLDGEPLPAGADRPIRHRGCLQILDLRIDVEVVPDFGGGFSLQHTGTMARQMVGEALLSTTNDPQAESAYFEMVRGPGVGQKLIVPDDLERGRIADDDDARLQVAGMPCPLEIFREGDGFGIRLAEDADDAVAVTVAQTPLGDAHRLHSGDLIAAGGVELRFVDPLESYLNELDGAAANPTSTAEERPSEPRPGFDTVTGDVEPSPTSELDESEDERQNPDSSMGLGPVEVGAIALSVMVLAGVVYLLLSIFGLV